MPWIATSPSPDYKECLPPRAMLYFDHNATSPLCAAARDAWLEAVDRFIGNPSSPHRVGRASGHRARHGTGKTRRNSRLRSRSHHWTSGATESNNTAVQHFAAEMDRPRVDFDD
jgi:cysteine desulfurase